MVNHSAFYHALRNSLGLMQSFLQKMSSALNHFARLGIVHADLKSDNILVNFDESTGTINSLKVIDFGSAFVLKGDEMCLKN